ncbi:MAG TPA: hypothetical protein VGC88_04890 [Terriglobales bacterium]
MATIAASPSALHAAHERVQGVPWYLWCSALAVTSACVGLQWDISWHRSVGRDTFWTPAHLAIQFCGILAGIVCGYLILHTTFAKESRVRATSVRVLGFRGPLGAFIAAWGGLAMIVSAPFDNWWHDAYGLDVKIVSPPHTLLALGILGVCLGSLVLILGAMNRAEGAARKRLEWMFLYVSGMIFLLAQLFIMESLLVVWKHTSGPYRVLALVCPALFAGAAFTFKTGRRFPATTVATIYLAVIFGLTIILPLFPAQPKLGPVYQNITYFVPPPFPPLVIVPALALDLLWIRARHWNVWLLSAATAVVFVAFMLVADWNMAAFILHSKLGQARFFHVGYLDYGTPLTTRYSRREFLSESPAAFWTGMAWATVYAFLSARIGIARGIWMQKVKR